MGLFDDKKKLLQDLKNVTETLKDCNDENIKKSSYFYIDSVIDTLLIKNKNKYYYSDKYGFDIEEFNKFEKEYKKNNGDILSNLFTEKEFYKQLFNDLCTDYLDLDINLRSLYKKYYKKMSKYDFYDLFKLFCTSIGKEDECRELLENKRIFNIKSVHNDSYSGVYLGNNINKTIVINNIRYYFADLVTLVHEFGHYIELGDLLDSGRYDELFYYNSGTLKDEVISMLYEKLFLDFMSRNDYMKKETDNTKLFTIYEGLQYIYNSYMLLNEMRSKKQRYIIFNDDLNKCVFSSNGLGLLANSTYGLGEYYSTILSDDIKKNGFDSKLLNKFYNDRFNKDTNLILCDEDFNSCKYKDIKNKELKILKKN